MGQVKMGGSSLASAHEWVLGGTCGATHGHQVEVDHVR